MMKYVTVFSFIFLLSGFKTNAQSFAEISNKVHTWKKEKGLISKDRDAFNEARLAVSSSNKLPLFDTLNCLYFLESSDLERGMIYGLIWSGDRKVNYTYYRGDVSFDVGSRFTSYMVHLVEKWDLKAIKQEERMNGNLIPSSYIYATKVIKNNSGGINIKSISFRDFFEPDRDR
jgi:hypothetical protein